MIIKIGKYESFGVWEGIFYKPLSHYPDITEWEIKSIRDFIAYEQAYGRKCTLECDNAEVLDRVTRAVYSSGTAAVAPPPKITECTACLDKGCLTTFVCHTSPVENAIRIFQSGKLLSAVNARGLPAAVLQQEPRNAAGDPADYFDYIMFAWGNCQAGDRLVMERKYNRFPTERDLSVDFTPGVRFYFHYSTLQTHPNAVHDGVLPLKVKDELVLSDWVHAIVIPQREKPVLESYIPPNLRSRVYYLQNDCKDIWAWSKKVYTFIEKLGT